MNGGRLTSNVVSLLLAAATSGSNAVSREDPYWGEALRELLTHLVDLAVFGTEASGGTPEVRMEDLLAIVESAPTDRADARSASFRSGRCYELLRLADEGREKLDPYRYQDLVQTANYFLLSFPGLASKTRSIITSSFTAKVSGLLRSPLRELFCTRTDQAVEPERSFEIDERTGYPKIIVLHLPVKLYNEVGRFAQVLYKTVWQRAVERRTARILQADPLWRPVFQWADESQFFVTSEDALFQQTARSSMVATVYLTQNLPSYFTAIGENPCHSLLGNLQTKVFHCQGDVATNEWTERVFARDLQSFLTRSISGATGPTEASSFSPVIPAIKFTQLKKGGPSPDPTLNGRVGGYVFQAGRQWRSQTPDRHYHEFLQQYGPSGH